MASDATETVRDLDDWWVFYKPKYDEWRLAVPNESGTGGMRLGIHLSGLEAWPKDQAEAIGNRIMACLNGCQGINPEAVGDLLAACKAAETYFDEAIEVCTSPGTRESLECHRDIMIRAIQKAAGKTQ